MFDKKSWTSGTSSADCLGGSAGRVGVLDCRIQADHLAAEGLSVGSHCLSAELVDASEELGCDDAASLARFRDVDACLHGFKVVEVEAHRHARLNMICLDMA